MPAQADALHINVTITGTTATLDAEPAVRVTGDVAGVSGTCPALTITVNGTTVHTSSATTFGGEGCADIKTGDSVTAAGARQGDGSILAAYVSATSAYVTVTGTLAGKTGTCPSVVLSVDGASVHTSSATVYSGESCSGLHTGDRIEAVGTRQGDGSVLASKISATSATTTITGTVAALSGTCPVLTITVNDATIHTTSSTTFGGKACGDVKSGISVGASGTRQSDGSMLATYVSVGSATQ
jgi:hypothetical protein